MPAKKKPTPGAVAFLATGPGDPDLLTRRALTLLGRAGAIIADPEALEVVRTAMPGLIPSASEPAAKASESTSETSEATTSPDAAALTPAPTPATPATPSGPEVTLAVSPEGQPLTVAARTRLVIDAARSGAMVVRLLAGDPVLEGTLAPEIAAIAKAGLQYEVVPGVATITATAAYAGIGLTGGNARTVHILDVDAPHLDWTQHADASVTLVVLHAGDRVADVAKELIAVGRPETTPILLTHAASTLEQRSIVSTLADVAAAVKASKHTGEATLVIGDVVTPRAAQTLSWFEQRPLLGWRVLVPLTKDDVGPLAERLHDLGASVTEVPTISVEPPRTPQQMERSIHGLVSGRYEWIAFTSPNAVRAVHERFVEYGLDARSFAGLKIAAIGENTVDALRDWGLRPDLVPAGEQTTASLLDEWPTYDELIDPINRVFLPRADIATETLAEGLVTLGWEVDDVTAYRTVRAAPPAASVRDAIKTGGFDAVLFTSSSTVRNLVGIAGKPHATTVVACIGPQTAKTAEEHGLRVDVLAEQPTVDSLLTSLAAHGEALRAAALEGGEPVWRPSRRRAGARRKA